MRAPLAVAPPDVVTIARALAEREDVLGVYWGRFKKRGRWCCSSAITVHVASKAQNDHERGALAEGVLDRRIGRYRVDILEVGMPRLHAVDYYDSTDPPDLERRSTITALAASFGDTVLLLSGHGALPAPGGQISDRVDPSDEATVVIDDDGAPVMAKLHAGRFGGDQDWAMATVDAGAAATTHPLVGFGAPFRSRTRILAKGSTVRHWSRVRDQIMEGTYMSRAAGVSQTILGPDGVRREFDEIITVAWTDDEPFSIPGDSGSLVFDDDDEVVGIVVGGADELGGDRLSYLLPITPIAGEPDSSYELFFE